MTDQTPESTGNVPFLNQPASGLAREYPLTGYRTSTDDNGVSNLLAATDYLVNLDSIPKDKDGKYNVYLLNDVPGAPGSAAPLEMFRRGLLEIGTASFLDNAYPEWVGDATDDAQADLESLQIIHSLKEYGYDSLNAMLNAERDEDGEVRDENNILYLSMSAVAQELETLMVGRKESHRLEKEKAAADLLEMLAHHQNLIDWARSNHNLNLTHYRTDPQGIYSPTYITPDRLTMYILWDNPPRIAVKKVRLDVDTPFSDESVEVTHYMRDAPYPENQTSHYPNPA